MQNESQSLNNIKLYTLMFIIFKLDLCSKKELMSSHKEWAKKYPYAK